MTFRQLEYVIEVADQGSISMAARKLMISQPSLSQSIKSIEKEFNITLFDRSSVPLVPTKAGTVFLNKAHIILTALEDLKKETAQVETAPRELVIGISDSAALINKHIFRDFQQQFPDVNLVLVERDQYQLERMLEAGKLDMMFTMHPMDDADLEIVPLVEDEFLIALPRTHPQVQKAQAPLFAPDGHQLYFPTVELEACKDVHFVLSGKDRLKFAQLSALRTAFEPRIGFETDSLSSSVAIAAYEPHGCVIPKLFATLYDGPDKPCFFRCSKSLPHWKFALSLQKGRPLSEPALQYIYLFLHYIQKLGMLTGKQTPESILTRLKKAGSLQKKETITYR